jgi:hypothetical protein
MGRKATRLGTPCVDCKQPLSEENAEWIRGYLVGSRCKKCRNIHRKVLENNRKASDPEAMENLPS